MLTQRETRYHKRKIIGGNFLKNVYDKVRNVISAGSKILNRIPTGIKTEMKNIAAPLLKKAATKMLGTEPSLSHTIEPIANNVTKEMKKVLSDRSRAILSNLIAGSGLKNYI